MQPAPPEKVYTNPLEFRFDLFRAHTHGRNPCGESHALALKESTLEDIKCPHGHHALPGRICCRSNALASGKQKGSRVDPEDTMRYRTLEEHPTPYGGIGAVPYTPSPTGVRVAGGGGRAVAPPSLTARAGSESAAGVVPELPIRHAGGGEAAAAAAFAMAAMTDDERIAHLNERVADLHKVLMSELRHGTSPKIINQIQFDIENLERQRYALYMRRFARTRRALAEPAEPAAAPEESGRSKRARDMDTEFGRRKVVSFGRFKKAYLQAKPGTSHDKVWGKYSAGVAKCCGQLKINVQ